MSQSVVSLSNFDETNPRATLNSPRSLQACKLEGVLPQELSYKPIEAFQERGLSPRLVKLRYDFFEAKRRDLLAASRKARETLLTEERHTKERENNQLDTLAQQSGLSKGAILALNSDGLKLERQKLLRAQEQERNWLKQALKNELRQLQTLEHHTVKLAEEANNEEAQQREASQRMKEINDKRALQEERKAAEAEARQRLEKQIAKEEFLKQQEELKRRAETELERQKEVYRRQLEAMEKKKEAELEKERKREAAYQEMMAAKERMRAQDLKRMDLMDQQRQQLSQAMREKKNARDYRILESIEKTQDMDRRRREEFEERQRIEQEREERMAQERALTQEEAAKRAFQAMMRRKFKQEDAQRKSEERRECILEQQEETESRLLEHEQKKERYLDFKRELDGLRAKNKEINVERQRRKEEALRESIADQVRRKDEKMEWLQSERKRLWQIRRATQTEAYRAREMVKTEIMRQRVNSRFNAQDLAKHVNGIVEQDLFTPKILQTTASMPTLRSAREHQDGLRSQESMK